MEQLLRRVSQLNDQQVSRVLPVVEALVMEDYDEVERLYRKQFTGADLEKMLSVLEKTREE